VVQALRNLRVSKKFAALGLRPAAFPYPPFTVPVILNHASVDRRTSSPPASFPRPLRREPPKWFDPPMRLGQLPSSKDDPTITRHLLLDYFRRTTPRRLPQRRRLRPPSNPTKVPLHYRSPNGSAIVIPSATS